MERYTCPVCGYTGMPGPYKGENDFPSYEICDCCGTEFGNDDDKSTHAELRDQWISKGMTWWAKYKEPSPNWDPVKQLSLAGLAVKKGTDEE